MYIPCMGLVEITILALLLLLLVLVLLVVVLLMLLLMLLLLLLLLLFPILPSGSVTFIQPARHHSTWYSCSCQLGQLHSLGCATILQLVQIANLITTIFWSICWRRFLLSGPLISSESDAASWFSLDFLCFGPTMWTFFSRSFVLYSFTRHQTRSVSIPSKSSFPLDLHSSINRRSSIFCLYSWYNYLWAHLQVQTSFVIRSPILLRHTVVIKQITSINWRAIT